MLDYVILSFNVYTSIYTYIFAFISVILFLYYLSPDNIFIYNTSASLNSLSVYKKINFFLFVCSFIGIPPLLGFFSKMLMFISFLYNGDYLFLSIFILLNAYLMYFYLQQMRFVKPEYKKSIFYKKIDPAKPITSVLIVL
jgi:NADH:ubiquinone oxidoreductase subunit 2 (subunit N)